ncbi:MAG: hypothetical protein VX183_06465 [Pseudomonadota bacterium]|nr:hypothetical protein [Pseudomonadota bacterium]
MFGTDFIGYAQQFGSDVTIAGARRRFGPMQARLSQALRRGLGRPVCRRLLAQGPAGAYRDSAAWLSGVVNR